MNQDQVKESLIGLRPCQHDFNVTFSGKKSIKVNGKYYPDRREIIINNKNFNNQNSLIYTAIHEFAHHVVNAELGRKEAHTILFWATFHDLLGLAEKKGLYVRESVPEIAILVKEVKEIDTEIGKLTIKMGKLLHNIQVLCQVKGVRYEDVVDRDLKMKRTTIKKVVKIASQDIPADIGREAQELIASISSEEKAAEAYEQINAGKSIDQIKQGMKKKPGDEFEDRLHRMETEKHRLEKTISMLNHRLDEVTHELEEVLSA